jgi:hypothetical protein
MSEQTRDPELTELENALATLRPVPAAFDRDRLMFRAGLAAGRRRRWLWPWAAVALALLATGLAMALVIRPNPQVVERVVYRDRDEPPSPPAVVDVPADSASSQAVERYFRFRDELLSRGIDAIPESPAGPPAESPERIEQSLGLPGHSLSRPRPAGL